MSIQFEDLMLQLADGVQIHALHGRHPLGAGRPTLVFLHEALGHIRMWKQFPQQLAERCGCDLLIYERQGYGGSTPIELPRSDDYLLVEGEYYLAQVTEAAGIERMILIGHSDGGSIALLGAACLGDRVRGLITEAAHINADELTLAGVRKAVDIYRTTDLHQRLERYHGDRTELLFRAWTDTWLRESFHLNIDLSPWLSQIRCPALIMQGRDDQYGLPQQVQDICQGIGEQAQAAFIDDCGHIPHLERPDAVLDLMVPFIRSLIN
ncbi:alpha/beta hydrolase [Marinobacterium zhoushanense]|uniref:Alpha/beta hydrolase n=1 Tax=Marinobacterium zhoushanense TaxID=1679163 RepID=A0ABQ1KC54_9GAMM|nr:alpha/beta hydrolase [Marinobacterium zhoushanense]GGB91462.1 alpha/beta hydrolase [Marinobacterium zhoushanense]